MAFRMIFSRNNCLKLANSFKLHSVALSKLEFSSQALSRNLEISPKQIEKLLCSATSILNTRTITSRQNVQVNLKSLEEECIYADSVLRRGSFLRKRSILKLLETMKNSQNVSSAQILFILRCCGPTTNSASKEERTELVSQTWSTFLELGLPLDVSHYNSLLQLFIENEAKFSPLEFLATLEKKDIEPNRITYSRLIAKFCLDGDINGANKILEFLKAKNLPIGEYVFNYLILGNSRMNDLAAAESILEVMKSRNITPGPDTYAALLQAYSEHKDVNKIASLLKECAENDIKISDKSLLDCVCILADKNFVEPIPELMKSLRKFSGYLTVVQYATNKLLHNGHHSVAFDLYKTLKFDPAIQYGKSFFISQLAASDCFDLHVLAKYCDEIKKNGWHVLPYEVALESYLEENKFDRALGLMRLMQEEKGIELKEHYFYPILCHISTISDEEKKYQKLEEVLNLYVPEHMTFFSYFLPQALISNPINFENADTMYSKVSKYRNYFDGLFKVYSGIVEFLLASCSTDVAAQFVSKNPQFVDRNAIRYLTDSYLKDLDGKSTVRVLCQMLPFNLRVNREEVTEEDSLAARQVAKDMLYHVLSRVHRRNAHDNIFPLIQSMKKSGLTLDSTGVSILKSQFQNLPSHIITEIESLCVADAVSFQVPFFNQKFFNEKDVLEKIAKADQDGEFDLSLHCQLLLFYIRNNLEEAEKIIQKIKRNNEIVSPEILVLLVDAYLDAGRLNDAENVFNSIVDDFPSFQVFANKTIRFACELVKQDRVQDAVKCLLMNSPKNGEWPRGLRPNFYQPDSHISTMLRHVADKNDIESLKLLKETLLSKKYAQPRMVLPHLVNYYIKQDNLEEALNVIEQSWSEYETMSGKHELMVACIVKEDSEKIQRLIDLGSEVFGEMNSLYDLVFAFLELNKVDQARRIFETKGLRANQKRLSHRCEAYLKEGKITQLEGLVDVTKGLFNVDRQAMYKYLLQGIISQGDPNRALGVWTLMQEENIEPTNEFLRDLGIFLQSKNCEVPFAIPPPSPKLSSLSLGENTTSHASGFADRIRTESSKKDFDGRLSDACNKGDLEAVERIWNDGEASNHEFSYRNFNRYLGVLLKHNKFTETQDIVQKMFTRGRRPAYESMRKILMNHAEKGDTDAVISLGNYLNQKDKKLCRYRTALGDSFVMSKKFDDFLTEIKSYYNKYDEVLPTHPTLRLIMDNQPDFIDKLKELSSSIGGNFNEHFISELWDLHFSRGQLDEANTLYEKHLKDSDNIKTASTRYESLKNRDTQLLDRLLDVLDSKPEGRKRAKGWIYSTYIDILDLENKHSEAISTIHNALKSISLEDFRRENLVRFKNSCLRNNLEFPFEIPPRITQTSNTQVEKAEQVEESSSSSSDDEKESERN